jgi:hypothetical protein
MLADANKIDANLIGEDSLIDQVADDLRRMQRPAIRTVTDITEGVETEFDRVSHLALLPSSTGEPEPDDRTQRAARAANGREYIGLHAPPRKGLTMSIPGNPFR